MQKSVLFGINPSVHRLLVDHNHQTLLLVKSVSIDNQIVTEIYSKIKIK